MVRPKVRTLCPICGGTMSQTYRCNSSITTIVTQCLNPECNYKVLLVVPTVVLIREEPEVFREVVKRGTLTVVTQVNNWRCSWDVPTI